MLTKRQETILKYLLSLKRDNQNKINISKSNYTLRDVPENDFISTLNYFEQDNLINKHWYDIRQKDFNYTIEIELLPKALTYFQDKKSNKKHDRRDVIKTYIPITISLISLVKSFEEEIKTVIKFIIELIK